MSIPITIEFPQGVYVFTQQNYFKLFRNNINVYGKGKDNTVIIHLGETNTRGLRLDSGPKREGFQSTEYIDRFVLDGPTINKNYLELVDEKATVNYRIGMIVFIRFGASFYNQSYGEINKVSGIEGNRIYFDRQMSRNYLPDTSPHYGVTKGIVKVPPPGEDFSAVIKNGPNTKNHKSLTIDRYNFNIIANNGETYILNNSDNAPSIEIPDNSKVYRTYGIDRLRNNVGGLGTDLNFVENLKVKDITFIGSNEGLEGSNAYNVELIDCRFVRDESVGAPTAGLSYEMDMSRGIDVINCEFVAKPYKGSQVSRSTGDVNFINCKFKDTDIAFSEFNFNCVVNNCVITSTTDSAKQSAGISVGASCTGIKIINNTLYLDGYNSGIGSSDIQTYPVSTNIGNIYSGNTFMLTDVPLAMSVSGGHSIVSNNNFYGNFISCLSVSGRSGEYNSEYPYYVILRDNSFISNNISRIMYKTDNILIEGNVFRNTGLNNDTPFGNIITNHASKHGYPQKFQMINNTFDNWYLQNFSVHFVGDYISGINLKNNHFINCINSDEREFTIDFKDLLIPTINRANKLFPRNEECEYINWLGVVYEDGGELSELDKYIGRSIIRKIYSLGLREKILRLNLFIGDAKASLIPILGYGYDYGTPKKYKDGLLNGMQLEDYNPMLGWVGDGYKQIEVLDSEFADYASMGFMLQVTSNTIGESQQMMGKGGSGLKAFSISRRPQGNIFTINRNSGGSMEGDKGFIYRK